MVNLTAIEQLATDQASLKAAAGLVKPAKWSSIGASHDAALIWGECAGSGAHPYRVMADLRDLGNKCTCPSRKFPCKHGLALLWLKADAVVAFPAAETPEWVSDWLGRRRTGGAAPTGGAAKPAPVAASKDLAAAQIGEPDPAQDEKAAARREAANAKRAEDTERAILDALDALEQWIGDQLRTGLGGFIDDATARCRRISARLVDGKAAALAGQIDEMPARLLSLPAGERVRGATVELGRLVLLARAFRADPRNPEVRRVVAVAESREAMLADSATLRIKAVWEVLAERVLTRRDGLVSQTTWLLNLGADGPRFAMLLDYFPASAGRRGSAFVTGDRFLGELAFYPAQVPLRAVLLARETGDAMDGEWPDGMGSDSRDDVSAALAAPLLAEPWADARPVLLPAGRIGFDRAGVPWWRSRDGAHMLPVSGELAALATGADLTRTTGLWSGGRLELLAAQSPWGRIDG